MINIRDQVFEVIVRQALAGAPWRQICAGPMQVNNISENEVQKEVDRRLEMIANTLSDSEKELFEKFHDKWESIGKISWQQTLASLPEIEAMVNRIYALHNMQPPQILFMHSPATFAAALFTLNTDRHSYQLNLTDLCREQDAEFQTKLLEEMDKLRVQSGDLGENCTSKFSEVHNQFSNFERDFFQNVSDRDCPSSLKDFETRKLFRTTFRQKFTPMLSRYGLVFDMCQTQIPLRVSQEVPHRRILGDIEFTLVWPVLTWAFYTLNDMLANSFIDEVLQKYDLRYIDTEAYALHLALFEKAPWYSFFENYCFVGTNPAEVVRDLRLRLSNTSGAAIEFADGYKVFALNGMETPRRFLEKPETLRITDIQQETNIEKRRGLVELYGTVRYLKDAGAKLIHSDEFGELYQIEIQDDEPLTMVKVKNSTIEPDGTYKEYFLRVPPSMSTAQQAVAWTFNMDKAEDYRPQEES